MKTSKLAVVWTVAVLAVPLLAEEPKPRDASAPPAGDSWTRVLKDRSERGKLHDAFQNVRGDSGKWRDEPSLQHAPPLDRKPVKLPLDDWADQLNEKLSIAPTAADDNWLIFRSRQLDDNDRLWVERVERKGNQFTVVLSEAIWQGRYFKTFTYYGVWGVNLGKLPPGEYQATWVVQPLVFKQFEGDGRPLPENWSKDERPGEKKPVELRVDFAVSDRPANDK
jgi:hypothetical protein